MIQKVYIVLESFKKLLHGKSGRGNNSELILCLHPFNERRRYKLTPSLIDGAQT